MSRPVEVGLTPEQEAKLSPPTTQAGWLQRLCLQQLREHEATGGLPTSATFIYYELKDQFPERHLKPDEALMRPLKTTMLRENNIRTGFFERERYEAIRTHLSEPAQVVTDTSYITGWRIPTELLTRRWAHIDFDAGWLRLDPGETNNDDGRQFPLTPDLRAILEAQRHRTSEIERETGTIIPWVFHRNGQPIKSLYKGWRAACKAAGFPTALMHDFRRTAVRNLERAGVPRSAAMKMTGHKTEAVYRRYAIVDEAMLVDSGQKLQALHERHQASPSSMGQVIPLRTKEAKGWRSTKWISSSTC
jgi:integrase